MRTLLDEGARVPASAVHGAVQVQGTARAMLQLLADRRADFAAKDATGRMRRHAASGGRRPPRAAILV